MSKTLSDIAGEIGIPVVQLTPQAITRVKERGLITSNQEQKLLAELKEADGIWENPIRGVGNAKHLW